MGRPHGADPGGFQFFMTRTEIYNNLKASREINNFSRSRNWKSAFELYKKERGENLSLGCTKCFEKVKEWLEQ